ncbi:tRNA-modifying protein YgfZ [Vibrio sp. RC27]
MTGYNDVTHTSIASNEDLPSLALSPLSSWGYISLSGEDSTTFLQGQVTCDVKALTAEHVSLGAHCDAKGKMWSVFTLFHHNDEVALFQPLSAIETELKELKKYAIFSKVELKQGSDICLGLIGKDVQSYMDKLTPDQTGDVRRIEGGSAVKISNQRWLLMFSPQNAQAFSEQFSAPICDDSLWTLLNIIENYPVLTQAEQAQHIPQALNLHALGGISFTKGCYTGQETVARAKYRGTNKRAMYRVSGPRSNADNINLERSVGENWRSAGTLLTSFQFNDNHATGLIILPNNLEATTQLRLSEELDAIWKIEALPYSLDEE